ncbi:MAG: hypothetical protein ABI720_01960 [Actinomycetes bacterium]
MHTRHSKALIVAFIAGLSMGMAGCGGDADESSSTPESATSDLAGGLEDAQDQAGGGSATLTVGDETYAFDGALCAFDDETGNEDFDFSLSAIGDGMQLSVDSGPTYGDNVSLDDIEDFENPKVGWSSDDDGFLTIDGLDVSGEAQFTDTTDETLQTKEMGELVATCP